MKIGIIGAGNIGGTIAAKLAAGGHQVKLAAAEGPDHIREQAEKIGAEPVTVEDAPKDVEVLVLSIPFGAIPELADVVAAAPADAIVIDTSNYYPQRDGQIADVDAGTPESVWASQKWGRPVVKTFNAALAHTLAANGKPAGTQGRLAMPVAGDDARGKTIAMQLVDTAGFDPVDAGDLADSWRQQPGTPGYCTELTAPDLEKALASADKARQPLDRDALMNEFMSGGAAPSHDFAIKRNREVTTPR